MNKIAILDMGLNNIKSIFNLSNKISDTYVFSKIENFKNGTKMLILPGNGNFAKGMEFLNENNFTKFIKDLSQDINLLGICLGMQLLMDSSEEASNVKGLSLISGNVVKIKENKDYNNPLLGWYDIKFDFRNDYEKFDGSYFFNNNFIIDPVKKEYIYGYLDYMPVFIIKEKIYGIQFHPELSRNLGLTFVRKIFESLK